MRYLTALMALCAVMATQSSGGERMIDLTDAVIVVSASEPQLVHNAATLLAEEVESRTGLIWPIAEVAVYERPAVIIEVTDPSHTDWTGRAYRVRVDSPDRVVVTGAGPAGVMHGAGHVLRKLDWHPGAATLPADFYADMRPKHPLAGHKLSYSPMNNTIDAWGPEDFERHIRELVIFGNTAIECRPARSEAESGPLMRYSTREINQQIFESSMRYGQEFWISMAATWDLTVPAERREALQRNEATFRDMPHIDNMMVAGGDPGHNHPRDLLPYLKDIQALLTEHHPNAGIWFSLQKYEPDKEAWTYAFLREERPDWIRGIAAGPWDPGLHVLRDSLPAEYPIRAYPDITHNMRAQFPVPWWDPALNLTLGREGPNPRPEEMAILHEAYTDGTVGFIAYTEGNHDDVNKTVWNMRSWSPTPSVREILMDYSRFFFGPDVAEAAADGILALERNWQGPLATNGGVAATLTHWRELEAAHPELADNWRWQFLLLRAYYDEYVRERVLFEDSLEQEAYGALLKAPEIGADAAMVQAFTILNRADVQPVHIRDMQARLVDLFEALWQSIRYQSSVEKYGALNPQRSAIMDFLDRPLNERWWLEDQFVEIQTLESEDEKLARLEAIRTWERPGEGSFYDDIGNVAKMPNVIRGETLDTDPFMLRNPNPFAMWWESGFTRARTSWISDIHWPIGIRYDNLDRQADYVVRMTGVGDIQLRINGTRAKPAQYGPERTDVKEWQVPREALADGTIILTFDDPDAGNIHWREWSRVNEVWLLKR